MNQALKNYLDLARVSNLPTVWTNVLTAVVLTSPGFSAGEFFLPACALSLFYSGGMALNDICDIAFDTLQKPNRPLPSGKIRIGQAYHFTVGLFSLGFFLLFLMPYKLGGFAGFLLLGAIVAYDKFHKRHPNTVLLMAACRFLIFVVTATAISGGINELTIGAGIGQFFYVFLVTLVARHEQSRGVPYRFPLIPTMIAGISLVDGLILSLLVHPKWFVAGLFGAILTSLGQRFVKGD